MKKLACFGFFLECIKVRREKINERLKCLQDLVPGCYKVNKNPTQTLNLCLTKKNKNIC